MAVFDIDETVLAAKQWGDAVGANGEIPGALDFVKNLENQGYTIAYCTARPEENRQEVIAALSEYGFPYTQDLVYCIAKDGDNVPRYKKNTVKMLMDKGYDVEMFYDDQKINRSVVSNLGVPTVADLREVLTRRNPGSVGYINDKIDNQLVRNMARLKKKRVAADPAAPFVDFPKLQSNIGKDSGYDFAICAEEWNAELETRSGYYSWIQPNANLNSNMGKSSTGILRSLGENAPIYQAENTAANQRKIYGYQDSSTVEDEFGVRTKAFSPMVMNYNTYRYGDRFPGYMKLNSVMPFPIYESNNRYFNDRPDKASFTKPPAYATALFRGTDGMTYGITYSYMQIGLFVMSSRPKLKKKTWYEQIQLAFDIGLIAPWIKAKWDLAAEQMGRKSYASIILAYADSKNSEVGKNRQVNEVFEFAGGKFENPYHYQHFSSSPQTGKLISNVYWNETEYDLKVTYEGIIQMAKSIISGQTGGKTQREIRMEDFTEIRDLILGMLTNQATDFESAKIATKVLTVQLDDLQYDAKMKRLAAKSPSLAKDLQPIIDAKETLFEDIGNENAALIEVRKEKEATSRGAYNEIEQAARKEYEDIRAAAKAVQQGEDEETRKEYEKEFMEALAEQRRLAQDKLKKQIEAFRLAQTEGKASEEVDSGDE